jgi:quinol monooxygenase YgiN
VTQTVKVIAVFTAKRGQADALRRLLEGMIQPSRAEAGNLHYDLWQDEADPEKLVLDELYKDAAANTAHRESPHFKAYAATIGDLADRLALTLGPLSVE